MSRFEDFSFDELETINRAFVIAMGIIDHGLELDDPEEKIADMRSLFLELAKAEKNILIRERKHSGLEPMLGGSNGKEQPD